MLEVILGVLFVMGVVVIFSPFALSAHESRQEEERKPLDPAAGDPCWVCGVLESAHGFITGHAWRATPGAQKFS